MVTRPGVYTVELTVEFTGQTSFPEPVPATEPVRGDVLGTASGRFHVFVVPRRSAPLTVNVPAHTALDAPAAFSVRATLPPGLTLERSYVTTMMPRFVLQSTTATGSGRRFTYRYDPVALAADFPNLDVERSGQPVASDSIDHVVRHGA